MTRKRSTVAGQVMAVVEDKHSVFVVHRYVLVDYEGIFPQPHLSMKTLVLVKCWSAGLNFFTVAAINEKKVSTG